MRISDWSSDVCSSDLPQQPTIFASSARENIRYGRLEAGDADIEAAARSAEAHDFLSVLPAGYDEQLGERGARLSGGQQQRIAIARALLKDENGRASCRARECQYV